MADLAAASTVGAGCVARRSAPGARAVKAQETPLLEHRSIG
jgi:hypothetical protein